MKEIKVGIVGKRGLAFAGALKSMPGAALAAFCELNEDILNRECEKFGIPKKYTDLDRMLDTDLDAVIVATPMQLHVPQCVKALKARKHVMCEVTAAVHLDECHELRDAVEKSGRKYMMSENYCYIKANVLVRSLVKAGLFGEIYFGEGEYIHETKGYHHNPDGTPTWRYYWQVGKNGCTYCTHSLGPVMQWFDERVKTVSCLGSGVHTDPEHNLEDSIIMLCKTQSGKLVKVRMDLMSNRPHNTTYYSLQGTKGCYEAPRGLGDEHKIWLMDRSEDTQKWRPLWDFQEEYLPDYWKNPSEDAVRAGHGGGDYFAVKEFIDCIREDKQPPVDIYTALNWTAAGLCSERSIANGGEPVEVPEF